MTRGFLNKKMVIVAIAAAGVVSAVLVASSIVQARAQQQMMWSSYQAMPKINGSINVGNEVSNFVKEYTKVSFITAAETAQKQITNGTVLGGYLGAVQGYLTYTFFVVNSENQTGYLTIVDAGNGQVLYTSEGQPIGSFGPWGTQGYGGSWHGQWNTHGWGMWQH